MSHNASCNYTVVDLATDSTSVSPTGPVALLGIFVNTVLSAHPLVIKDGTGAVFTIPASTAAGTAINFNGTKFRTALVIDPDDAATGNITVMWRGGQ